MAVQTDSIPYSANNRALWGIRLLLAQVLGTKTSGYRHIGNIISPDLEQGIERYKHYSSPIGQDKLDWIVPIKAEPVFKFTTDEVSNKNLQMFMNATAPIAVAANAAATYGPDLFIAGLTGDVHGLTEGNMTDAQRAALKVYNVTTSALLVAGTDYNVINLIGETSIQMLVDTYAGNVLSIGTGSTANAAYNFVQKQAQVFAPLTNQNIYVMAKIQFFPVQGKALEWRIRNALITNGSKMNADKKAASSLDFELSLLDDSVLNPTQPFGTLVDYGYDDTGVPTL